MLLCFPAAVALLSLPAAVPNWAAATSAVPGAAWQGGTEPCGGPPGGAGATPWKGLTCNPQGQVIELVLSELGMAGMLPAELAALPDLGQLDLSGNAFRGGVPPAWLQAEAFPSLASANLARNRLAGEGG